jgi:transitional endoplasmic reticulum ATPase
MDMLDPAIIRPGRFDEIVEIPLPDEAGRADIFRIQLRNKPLAAGVSAQDLGSRTEGYSGADISAVCHQAALRAIRRAVHDGDEPAGSHTKVSIEATDLEAALQSIRR